MDQLTKEQQELMIKAWDNFVVYHAVKSGCVDKQTGAITLKSFVGSVEAHKTDFVASLNWTRTK